MKIEQIFPLELWELIIASSDDFRSLINLSKCCRQLYSRSKERIKYYRLKNWGYLRKDVDFESDLIISEPGYYNLREDIVCQRIILNAKDIVIDGHKKYIILYHKPAHINDKLIISYFEGNIIRHFRTAMWAYDDIRRCATLVDEVESGVNTLLIGVINVKRSFSTN